MSNMGCSLKQNISKVFDTATKNEAVCIYSYRQQTSRVKAVANVDTQSFGVKAMVGRFLKLLSGSAQNYLI